MKRLTNNNAGSFLGSSINESFVRLVNSNFGLNIDFDWITITFSFY